MRKPMVTRTVKVFTANVIAFNDSDNTTTEMTVETTQDNDKARQAGLPDGYRLIKTLNVAKTETQYGMTVEEFMKHATAITDNDNENKEE